MISDHSITVNYIQQFYHTVFVCSVQCKNWSRYKNIIGVFVPITLRNRRMRCSVLSRAPLVFIRSVTNFEYWPNSRSKCFRSKSTLRGNWFLVLSKFLFRLQ